MYRQFCKKLNYYMELNNSDSYRHRLRKKVQLLVDICSSDEY